MNSSANKKWVSRGRFVAALLLATPIVLVVWFFSRFEEPPVDLKALEKVTVGMPRESVFRILGVPSDIYDNGSTWAYGQFGSWGIVYVYFDASKRVTRTEFDR